MDNTYRMFTPSKAVTLEVDVDVEAILKSSVDIKPCQKLTINKLQKGASVMAERKQGSVKWFNSTKGFGFISQEGGEDVFVHFQSIVGDGYKSLEENDKVEFSVTQGPKGLQAADVRLISKN